MQQLNLFNDVDNISLENVLSEPPSFNTEIKLKIDALMPLSMNSGVPGQFYASASKPSEVMILGLLENALGIYLTTKSRAKLNKIAKKGAKNKAVIKTSKFESVLQRHVIVLSITDSFCLRYTDYFARQTTRDEGEARLKGGANHSYSLVSSLEQLSDSSDKATLKKMSSQVALFSTSPSKREYVEPLMPYIVKLQTSKMLKKCIISAIKEPVSPLFLGNSEGWVDVEVVYD